MNDPSFCDVLTLYDKNKDLKKDDIEMLKEWNKMQPHLPSIPELQLILFHHSCYYRNEATKKCIDNFYTMRTLCPMYFTNRDPGTNEFTVKLNNILITPLPGKTPEGYGIIYCRLMEPNPDNYDFGFQIKLFDMAVLQWLHREGCLPGVVFVTDMEGGTLSHMLKVTLTQVKHASFYVQEAFPFRLKGLHYVNPVSFIEKVINLIKPFIKKELMDLINIHPTKESLHKFIPLDLLPAEAGGTASNAKDLHAKLQKTLIESTDYFFADEKLKVIESKRQGKTRDAGEVFGLEGTFKKLDID